jgi:LmbE family N-acetylglucosaminyl deacetylase
VHRRLLSLAARDMSDSTLRRSAMVIAPHPDDETIGCGGTILRKTQAGTPVTVVVAADGGDPTRRAECVEACARLGIPEQSVVFLGFRDGSLAAGRAELHDHLCGVLRSVAPEEVFGPSAVDNHPDHRALAAAVGSACGTGAGAPTRYEYPVWFWNRNAWVDRSAPRRRQRWQLLWRPIRFTAVTRVSKVDITTVKTAKRHALAAHVSQVGAPGEPPAGEVLDAKWLETFLGRDEIFFRTRRD